MIGDVFRNMCKFKNEHKTEIRHWERFRSFKMRNMHDKNEQQQFDH